MNMNSVNQLCKKCDVLERQGGGGTLPAISDPATKNHIFIGKQAINGAGELMTGSVLTRFNQELELKTNVSYDDFAGLKMKLAPTMGTNAVDTTTVFKILPSKIQSAIGLTADKIVAGNTVLGVVGTSPYPFESQMLNLGIMINETSSYKLTVSYVTTDVTPNVYESVVIDKDNINITPNVRAGSIIVVDYSGNIRPDIINIANCELILASESSLWIVPAYPFDVSFNVMFKDISR